MNLSSYCLLIYYFFFYFVISIKNLISSHLCRLKKICRLKNSLFWSLGYACYCRYPILFYFISIFLSLFNQPLQFHDYSSHVICVCNISEQTSSGLYWGGDINFIRLTWFLRAQGCLDSSGKIANLLFYCILWHKSTNQVSNPSVVSVSTAIRWGDT